MTRQFDPAEIPPSPDLRFESRLWASGLTRIAGLDEAGRGAWAGPVSAGAVILPPDPNIAEELSGVRDSKQMKPAEREEWAEIIRARALAWGVGFASNLEIDALGIVPATRLAMCRALERACALERGCALERPCALECACTSEHARVLEHENGLQGAVKPCPPGPAEHLLIDALRLPELPIPQTPLIKGDARSLSIAAASVLAKTARDALMMQLDEQFPAYGFARHKGYGTAIHWEALQNAGPCEIHRFSFGPVRLVAGRQAAR